MNIQIIRTANGRRHSLYQQAHPSDKLLVLLPGRGYTNHMPLLYYLRIIGLNASYDVLAVNYSFHLNPDLKPDFSQLPDEVAGAMAAVSSYSRICFAGKSLGSPLAVTQAQRTEADAIRLLLLTPIQNVAAMTGDIPTLAVIGTADPYYKPEDITPDDGRWLVLEGLDHGLEKPGDWGASVNALHTIMSRCEQFLKT